MENLNLTRILKQLEEINSWFDSQEELDLELGLQKVKEGMQLVKASRMRLKQIENEFEEIKILVTIEQTPQRERHLRYENVVLVKECLLQSLKLRRPSIHLAGVVNVLTHRQHANPSI